jgi:hypothetical protein
MAVYPYREHQFIPILPLADYSTNPTAGTEYPEFFSALGYRGVRLYVDIDAVGASTSLTYTLYPWDPVKAQRGTLLLASAAKTGAGAFEMTVYPGIGVTANVSASNVLSGFWALGIAGTADGADYIVTAELIP